MSPKPENRPREVTFGVVAVVILGVLVIARAFDALGGLESLETQKALRSALDSESARSLGVTVGALTDVLHAVILIGGAATAVSIVTAIHALKGNRSARWGLLVSGLIGGLGTLMFDPVFGVCLGVAAGVATISPRAAVWFDGGDPPPPGGGQRTRTPGVADHEQARPRSAPPATRPGAGDDDHAEGSGDSGDRTRRIPPPTEGFGQYRSPVATIAAGPTVRPRVAAPAPAPGASPASVRVAVLLTWVACLVAAVAAVGGIVVVARDRTPMVEWAVHGLDLEDASVTPAQVASGLVTILVVIIGWSALTIGIATLVHHGNGSARMLLVMDGVVAVAAALALLTSGGISGIAQLVGSIVLLAGTATAVLLLSPSAAAYFGDQRRAEDPPPAPPRGHRPDEDRLPPSW